MAQAGEVETAGGERPEPAADGVPGPRLAAELGHGPRKWFRAASEPGFTSQADDGEQDAVLGLEPGQRLLVVGHGLGGNAGRAADRGRPARARG